VPRELIPPDVGAQGRRLRARRGAWTASGCEGTFGRSVRRRAGAGEGPGRGPGGGVWRGGEGLLGLAETRAVVKADTAFGIPVGSASSRAGLQESSGCHKLSGMSLASEGICPGDFPRGDPSRWEPPTSELNRIVQHTTKWLVAGLVVFGQQSALRHGYERRRRLRRQRAQGEARLPASNFERTQGNGRQG